MRLRNKMFVILALVSVLYITLDAGVQRYFIRPSFLALEREEVTKNMQRWMDALHRDLEHVELVCFDWSAWDDTYAFVQDRNEAYIKANLGVNSFIENDLCLIFILSTDGKVVWGKGYDAQKETFVDIAEYPQDQWPPENPLLIHGERGSLVSGLYMTQLGPMLVAARPIFPSEGDAPARGVFVLARLLSESFWQGLCVQTHLDMKVTSIKGSSDISRTVEIIARRPTGTGYIEEASDKVLRAYSVFPDLYGQPALLFQLDAPRIILERGKESMHLDVLTMVVATLFVLAILMLLLQRHIIRPLSGLTRHAAAMSQTAEFIPYPGRLRNDEIGTLAREFNRMVGHVREEMDLHDQMEKALRDSEAQIRTILEAAPDGIITVNERGLIESVNGNAAIMFGYESDALIGKPLAILLKSQGQKPIFDSILQDFELHPQSKVMDHEITGIQHDGRTIPLHIRISPMPVGNRHMFVAVLRDMTEIRKMQARVALSRHLAAIGEMGASLAHEIRNPLAGISGAVQIILNDLGPEYKHREALKEVQFSIERVEKTVRRLLDYARSWHPEPKPCNIMQLIRETCREIASEERFRHIEFQYQGRGDLDLSIDPLLIRRVLLNLLENAADAMSSGGIALWSLKEEDNSILVNLQDNGCGIDPRNRERLTEPFFTTKINGTGLGLAICQRIMEAHGGYLDVDSQPGVGTTVRLIFPKGE